MMPDILNLRDLFAMHVLVGLTSHTNIHAPQDFAIAAAAYKIADAMLKERELKKAQNDPV
jgi:hypothetical protein